MTLASRIRRLRLSEPSSGTMSCQNGIGPAGGRVGLALRLPTGLDALVASVLVPSRRRAPLSLYVSSPCQCMRFKLFRLPDGLQPHSAFARSTSTRVAPTHSRTSQLSRHGFACSPCDARSRPRCCCDRAGRAGCWASGLLGDGAGGAVRARRWAARLQLAVHAQRGGGHAPRVGPPVRAGGRRAQRSGSAVGLVLRVASLADAMKRPATR